MVEITDSNEKCYCGLFKCSNFEEHTKLVLNYNQDKKIYRKRLKEILSNYYKTN